MTIMRKNFFLGFLTTSRVVFRLLLSARNTGLHTLRSGLGFAIGTKASANHFKIFCHYDRLLVVEDDASRVTPPRNGFTLTVRWKTELDVSEAEPLD